VTPSGRASRCSRSRTAREATVKSHVNRVLSKLDLRDRTQAAGRAYESGLVEPGDAKRSSSG
jgi:hypothetical protein